MSRTAPDGPMGMRTARQVTGVLPALSNVGRVEYLDAGYSNDVKYVLWERGAPRYLLRLSDLERCERRRLEFELLARHRRRGVLCPEPFAFGISSEGEYCYSLLGYVPGLDAEQELPRLAKDRQFAIGREAGRQLRRMHELSLPNADFDWPARREAKYRRRFDEAKELCLTVGGMGGVEAYIEANLDLLRQAPVRFQHDDFHPANLIIQNGRLAGVIDFNRADWGDPMEDFHKLPWFTVPVSVAFARGQVEGYLSGSPTHDFWRRYNLYVAMSIVPSLIWGYREPRSSLQMFERLAGEIISTHDFTGGGPPAWW